MTFEKIKEFWVSIVSKLLTFGKLVVLSPHGDPKRRIIQYSFYFLLVIVVNVIVGKNIGNMRYPWYSNVSIFLLVNINIILILVLTLVIFRYLAKLLSDVQNSIFGSRLKVKLLIFSAAITVLPVTIILFLSTFINGSINRWFTSQIDGALASSIVLMEDYQKIVKQDLYDQSILISQIIADKQLYKESQKETLQNFMLNYVGKNLAVGVSVFDYNGSEILNYDNIDRQYLKNISKKYLSSILKGNTESGYEFIDNIQLYWVGTPVINVVNNKDTVYGALFSYKITPKKITDDIDLIHDARETYNQSEFFSFPIKKSYFMLLILVSLLVVFAGIWGSIFFAGNITGPIEELALASQEISKGNLKVSLQAKGNDEISYLVKTFNGMARDLDIHTRELREKNEILSEMYGQISRDNAYIDAIFRNVAAAIILFDHNKQILKSNSKANILLSDYKTEFEAKVMPEVEIFYASDLSETSKNIEMVVRDEARVFSLNLSKLFASDVERILSVLDDVTDIVNAQRISVWKEVATRIAHEVKNPLTPIKLVAERVKKRSDILADPTMKSMIAESMDTIVTETDNLLELVEDFNMFARLPKAKKYPIDIKSLINDTMLIYNDTYPNVAFDVNCAEGLIFSGDRHQLRRVIQNIVANAIHVINQKGVISLSTAKTDAGDIEIKIADDGPGISQEDIFKIFEPYFSKRSGGTGLGLAIVKRIIEEHNGKISVENGSNGAVFTIVLPGGTK